MPTGIIPLKKLSPRIFEGFFYTLFFTAENTCRDGATARRAEILLLKNED
jgi:hypothetical protein